MSTIEGAENIVDAPPASDTQQQQPSGSSFSQLMADDMAANLAAIETPADTANAAEVGTQQAEDAQQPENLGDAANAEEAAPEDAEREKFIPRERFDQVNAKAQALEAEKAERVAKDAEFAKERDDLAYSKRALAAGYYDTEAFRRADEWAAANDYGTAENALAAKAEMDRYAADRDREVTEGYRTQADRDEMVANKQLAVQAQAIANAAQLTAKQATQTLESIRQEQANYNKSREIDTAISEVKAQADAAGITPEAWAVLKSEFDKFGNAVAIRSVAATFLPLIAQTSKTAAEQAVIAHNARKAANGDGAAPPEGRGGGTAPPQLPKMTPQEAKSRSLSELLGFRK